MSLYNMISK